MRIQITGWVLFLISIATVISSKEKSDPCLDREIAVQPKLPSKYANLTPPWQLPNGRVAKIFQSPGFVYQWMWMKSLVVKGLGKKIQDVLDFMSDNNCLFVPIGPSVRQLILGQRNVFLSGEVSCDLHELHKKCVKKYGTSLCGLFPIDDGSSSGTYRLEIGDCSGNHTIDKMKAEPIVLHEWRSILGQPRDEWRFTVDTLAAYDNGFGTIVVIDPLQNGFDHLCEKKLIPTTEDWSRWSQNQPMKVLGFYELRADGFSAKNETFKNFIKNEVNVTNNRILQKFYCDHVLRGVTDLEGSTKVCHTQYADKQEAEKTSDIRTMMIHDLGSVWNTSVAIAAENLEAKFCTERQFVETRIRLLHKKIIAYDSESRSEEPKITDQPIVKNNSPNENLKIVTPTHGEGTGSYPVAIQENPKETVLKTDDEEEDEDEEEQNFEAVAYDVGKPVDPADRVDYTRHNFVNSDIPVMKFEKVEQEGLSDVAASAINISN